MKKSFFGMEDVKTIIGVLIFSCLLVFIHYYGKSTNCETIYNNFESKNPKISFIENNIKHSSRNNCIAYISIIGEFNNQNKIDLNLENGYSINTVGNNNWSGYYGFLVIDLDNESLLTGTLVRIPNEKDINQNSSVSFFNNVDIAASNAINYFNNL